MKCPICKSSEKVNFLADYKFEVIEDKNFLKDLKILKCNNCNLGFASPMPKESDLNNYYANVYRSYDRPPYLLTGDLEDLKLECLADKNFNYLVYLTTLIDFSKIKKIYDFGAGNGDLGYLLKKKFPHIELFCSEGDNQCKEILKERGYKNYEDLNEIKEKFDLIITLHSLEHLTNCEIFSFFKSILNENGNIFFEVPNCSHEYFEKRVSDSPHLIFFTKESFEKLNQIHGLKFLNFSTSSYSFDYDRKFSQDSMQQYENINKSILPILKIKRLIRKILPRKIIQLRRDMMSMKAKNSEDRIHWFINNTSDGCYIRGILNKK